MSPRTLIGRSIRASRKPGCFEERVGLPELLVDQGKRSTFELDLSAQLVAAASAEGSALCELLLGGLEPSFRRRACGRERTMLLLEEATAHLLLRRKRCALDLGSRVVSWS